MKKNKLVISASIVMLVASVLSLFLAVYTGLIFSETLELFFGEVVEGESLTGDSILLLTIWVSYIIAILIYLAEAVLYIVFGIKLLVKASKGVAIEQYKSIAVAMQIVCYVVAGLSIGGDLISGGLSFALSLTAGILLSVALSQNKKEHEKMLTSSFGSFKDNLGQVKMEDIPNGDNVKKPFNEKLYADELSGKLESIKALKQEGVIDEEEYLKMVHKILGIEGNSQEKEKVKSKRGKGDIDEEK